MISFRQKEDVPMREVVLRNEVNCLEFATPVNDSALVFSGSKLAKGVHVLVGTPKTLRCIDDGKDSNQLVVPFELRQTFLFDDGFIAFKEIASSLEASPLQ